MPVINIKSLPLEKHFKTSEILIKLCTQLAEKSGYKPEHVWAYWEFLLPGNYAVGNKTASTQTADSHSPIIKILSFEGNSQEKIIRMMETTAAIISEELKIDIGNIFIEYSEAYSGRVFDGGAVVFSK